MNDQPDTSFLARLLGQNWKTTIGGTLAAAGGVLATQTTGKWQIAGGIMLAVGLQWMGVMARDKGVSTAQMDAAGSGQPIPTVRPPTVLLMLLVCGLLVAAGCLVRGPLTVNVFSSRMALAMPDGTNQTVTASMRANGGADVVPSIALGDAVASNIVNSAVAYFTTNNAAVGGVVIWNAASNAWFRVICSTNMAFYVEAFP